MSIPEKLNLILASNAAILAALATVQDNQAKTLTAIGNITEGDNTELLAAVKKIGDDVSDIRAQVDDVTTQSQTPVTGTATGDTGTATSNTTADGAARPAEGGAA